MARKPDTDTTASENINPDDYVAESAGSTGTADPALGTPVGTETVMPIEQARAEALAGTDTSPEQATAQGYYGVSPVRLATGLDDKGLSQANPAVMNQVTVTDA